MENLSKVVDSLKSEDLVLNSKEVKTFTIEPTEEEIKQIVAMLLNGSTYKEIKMAVRRVVMDGEKQVSAQGFSYGQIKEIEMALNAKINVKEEVTEEITK